MHRSNRGWERHGGCSISGRSTCATPLDDGVSALEPDSRSEHGERRMEMCAGSRGVSGRRLHRRQRGRGTSWDYDRGGSEARYCLQGWGFSARRRGARIRTDPTPASGARHPTLAEDARIRRRPGSNGSGVMDGCYLGDMLSARKLSSPAFRGEGQGERRRSSSEHELESYGGPRQGRG
ncbi:hypothetical protein B2J93_8612 [Marssonina coronariae]|uniref:Uncharacterized protein n=1 Tax=Diplocarpon coronariae TaxID=2795749 RepID=A0A218YW84_9HELO|nr:hypothetical protein B2J93_8612 [Marssonina coronariae]